jgi:hypothetical protein
MIDERIIAAFIRIGEEEADVSSPLMALVAGTDELNRLGWQIWNVATATLSTEQVVSLAKGLVLAEKLPGWSCGSVDAAIWVFGELDRRKYDGLDSLADWILSRTHNPYVPFGTQNHGAKSLPEYKRRSEAWAKRKDARHSEIAAEQERAKAWRVARAQAGKERIERQVERQKDQSKTRQEELTELEALPAADRLRLISLDAEHSVLFYPTSWAEISQQELDSLPPECRVALAEKLRPIRKGPWKRLWERLVASGENG